MNGQQYKAEREALGLSQVRLAQLLGVTRHTIARRESGKSAVAAEAVLAIGSATVQAHRKHPFTVKITEPQPGEPVPDSAGALLEYIEENGTVTTTFPVVDSAEPTAQ